MKMHRSSGLAAVVLLAAAPALAQVDAKCVERWNKAVTLSQMAQQCKLGDAATAAKLQQVEASSLQCASARGTQADKAALDENATTGKTKIKSQLAGMPCGDDAKRYFEKEMAALK